MQAAANDVSCDTATKQFMKRFMKRRNDFCAFETNILKPFSGSDAANNAPKMTRGAIKQGMTNVQSERIEA